MTATRMLYKYRTLSGPYGLQNAADIILNDRMRWQSPTAFNDPFDCVPRFDTSVSDAAFRSWMKDALKRAGKGTPRADRRSAIAKKTRSKTEFIRNLETSFIEKLGESSVTCFSLAENHPLMWAHYADSHSGVMFQFEEPTGDIDFCGLNVDYLDQRPLVDPTAFLAGSSEIKKAILTKSSDWAYEEEVRMVEYRRAPGPRSFNTTYLKSVTLGLRISAEDRQSIINVVGRRRTSIPVLQSALDRTTYRITSRPV
ncbi:DUF2971 domain-containing protein [Sphingomonas aerolata]|uniref:DUF2971 domain-containing protein n=1 Tax=Sphingomonas aerolata TaxID=185951 RepID=UPI0033540673